ncbi:MAG: HNH endonuclease [Nanoarchaeota archaeon]|nr:HNH endonuclease [Nanoarchaeota archaeon]
MNWKNIQKMVLKRDNNQCALCGSIGALEIHHKKEKNNNLDNLITLCSKCHGRVEKGTAKAILHYPRLDTVLMVEKTIREAKEYPSKRQLLQALPKEVMYQTFNVILDYLEESGKIVIKGGHIIWIWDPEGVKKLMSRPELTIK